jgi:hypothetical protein
LPEHEFLVRLRGDLGAGMTKCITAILIVSAISAGAAKADTGPSVARQTTAWVAKRIAVTNSTSRVISARCRAREGNDFLCTVKLTNPITGIWFLDYKVTIRNGYLNWYSTG